jgi:hypothetical protein
MQIISINKLAKLVTKRLSKRNVIVKATKLKTLYCTDCRHFSGDGMCNLLSKFNTQTDELKTMHAVICREQDELCGFHARYFEASSTSNFSEKLDIDDYPDASYIAPSNNPEHCNIPFNKDKDDARCPPQVLYSVDGSSTFVSITPNQINEYYQHIQDDTEEIL